MSLRMRLHIMKSKGGIKPKVNKMKRSKNSTLDS